MSSIILSLLDGAPGLNVTRTASAMCRSSKKSLTLAAGTVPPGPGPGAGPVLGSRTNSAPYAKHTASSTRDVTNTPRMPTRGSRTPHRALATGPPSDVNAFASPILNVLVFTCVQTTVTVNENH